MYDTLNNDRPRNGTPAADAGVAEPATSFARDGQATPHALHVPDASKPAPAAQIPSPTTTTRATSSRLSMPPPPIQLFLTTIVSSTQLRQRQGTPSTENARASSWAHAPARQSTSSVYCK